MNDSQEIEDLIAELSRTAAARDSIDAAAGEPDSDRRALLDRQIAILEDTIEMRRALTRIQSAFSWRALEAFHRMRLSARRLAMAGRGWKGRRRRRPRRAFSRTEPMGVNVAGYLNTESGMGEAARLSVRSLQAAGVPVALNNVASRLRMEDATYTAFSDRNPHAFNLVHLNADNMEWFARERGREYFRNRYTIGYWFWELARFREDWLPAFGYVDEVWVPTEFGRQALAPHSPVPVTCVPLPVVAPAVPEYSRSHFGLPDDAYVFLFTFDVSSQLERKNPIGIISAFRAAFGGRQDVLLMLKFTNAEYDAPGVREMYRASEGINAVLRDGYMTRDELAALMAASNCYVSLHRSEGFGLGIAEAMALAKPVIATGYSGPADFLTPANSYSVDYRLVPIARDYGPYLEGFTWAEPDSGQASRLMRHVVDARDESAARGRRAALDIAELRSPARTGAHVRSRLESIWQTGG